MIASRCAAPAITEELWQQIRREQAIRSFTKKDINTVDPRHIRRMAEQMDQKLGPSCCCQRTLFTFFHRFDPCADELSEKFTVTARLV